MKTNFEAMKEITNYRWANSKNIRFGVVNEDEANFIRTELSLTEKSNTELSNARDFAVLYLEMKCRDDEKNRADWFDLMSMITYIIDCEKVKRGVAV